MIETPSGKSAKTENFPVGSFLLPRRLRPHVATYYAFARAIDDIADTPDLPAQEKIRRLDAMDAALNGEAGYDRPELAKATALRASMLATGVNLAHGRDLISAFRQDAVKTRYRCWAELMDYCDRSAAPVGRYLLELHGEDPGGFIYADALCNALQVLNHLQDCAEDFVTLNRVYLPEDWLRAAGETVDGLKQPDSSPGMRQVIDLCLAGTGELLTVAAKLPGALKSKSLAMESAVIIAVARRLSGELANRDPLVERVELTRMQYAACGLTGIARGLMA